MKKIKWGVIGCGGIAYRRTIPGMVQAEHTELVAVMDANPALAEMTAEEFRVPVVCESVEELLAQDIDAVYIATPVFCHREQVLAVMEAGKHILVEKPVGLTSEEVEEILILSEQKNIKIGVGFMMRFHTKHQKIKELVESKKIGDVVSMRAQFTCWYPEIEGSWRQDKKLSGGGAIMDLGVHCIDLLQYISGAFVAEVTALCDTLTFHYNVDDSASLLCRMNNGAHAYVDVNFNVPDDAAQSRLELYGTKGSIIADGTMAQTENGTVKVTLAQERGYDAMQNREKTNSYLLETESGNMYTKEIEEFSKLLCEEENEIASVRDALIIQKIVEAAYLSSETGRRVDL